MHALVVVELQLLGANAEIVAIHQEDWPWCLGEKGLAPGSDLLARFTVIMPFGRGQKDKAPRARRSSFVVDIAVNDSLGSRKRGGGREDVSRRQQQQQSDSEFNIDPRWPSHETNAYKLQPLP